MVVVAAMAEAINTITIAKPCSWLWRNDVWCVVKPLALLKRHFMPAQVMIQSAAAHCCGGVQLGLDVDNPSIEVDAGIELFAVQS